MILPTKHISANNTLLGAGASILTHLITPQTVSALWERVKCLTEMTYYWRFILTLDFLFALGVIDLNNGLIERRRND
jgi:hypothetical protein